MKHLFTCLSFLLVSASFSQLTYNYVGWMDPICSGSCDGYIQVQLSGGTLPYNVNLPFGMTMVNDSTFEMGMMCAGNYLIQATDAAAGTADTIIDLIDPPVLSVSQSTVDVSCFGSCDGSINAVAGSGSPPYQYSIDGGVTWQPTGDFIGLCSGPYFLEVLDATGCLSSSSLVINEPSAITMAFTAVTDDCGGACNGSATALATGGTPPYTYSWSSGQTTATGVNLCAGTHFVDIVDANGCVGQDSVVIVNNPTSTSLSATKLDASCGNGSITLTVAGGSGFVDVVWDHGDSLMVLNNLNAGTYIAHVYDSIGCYDSIHVTINDLGGATCSRISGYVAADIDLNCSFSGVDSVLTGVIIEAIPGPYYSVTDASGYYEFNIPFGTYTVDEHSSATVADHCSGGSFTITTSSGDSLKDNNNFLDTLVNMADVEVSCSNGFIRPGFNTFHWAKATNVSGIGASGVMQMILPAGITFYSASIAPDVISGDTLFWNVAGLSPGQFVVFHVYGVASGVTLGQMVTTCSRFVADQPEFTLLNNECCLTQEVVGSYDPNDKQVSPAGDILLTDETLDYHIRFQNTGTDTAFNIVITDTLTSLLDLATLQVTGASHPMTWSIVSGNVLKFTFANILLPDSNINEPLSHGWVHYHINQSAGNAVGQIIENSASIYFDFNDPVITNTTQSLIVTPLAISDLDDMEMLIYPNPAEGLVNLVSGSNISSAAIYASDGRLLKRIEVNAERCTLNLDNLSAGVYHLSISLEDGVVSRTIVLR